MKKAAAFFPQAACAWPHLQGEREGCAAEGVGHADGSGAFGDEGERGGVRRAEKQGEVERGGGERLAREAEVGGAEGLPEGFAVERAPELEAAAVRFALHLRAGGEEESREVVCENAKDVKREDRERVRPPAERFLHEDQDFE